MFNINGWELVVLVVVFLLVFGPDRLPETAVQMGKILRELRAAADEATSDLTRELEAAARDARQAESTVRSARSSVQKALVDAATSALAEAPALAEAQADAETPARAGGAGATSYESAAPEEEDQQSADRTEDTPAEP